MNPILKFQGYTIKKMFYSKESFEFINEEKFKDDKGLSLSVEQGVSEDLKDAKINLELQFKDIELKRYIVVEVEGYFEFEEINSVEMVKKILLVNGTAILYPYIRSVISMMTSLDSENAIILPTINTTALAKD